MFIDICFLNIIFWCKKQQNVRCQTDFQGKPNIIERHFSQNITVFYARYSMLFYTVFGQKRTKRKISGRFSGKDPYNRTTIFPKRNGFFMIDTSFFFRFFCQKKSKR